MTNAAAMGYMLLAARRLKFDRAMTAAMDEHTEQEAEEAYLHG